MLRYKFNILQVSPKSNNSNSMVLKYKQSYKLPHGKWSKWLFFYKNILSSISQWAVLSSLYDRTYVSNSSHTFYLIPSLLTVVQWAILSIGILSQTCTNLSWLSKWSLSLPFWWLIHKLVNVNPDKWNLVALLFLTTIFF